MNNEQKRLNFRGVILNLPSAAAGTLLPAAVVLYCTQLFPLSLTIVTMTTVEFTLLLQ